MAAHDAGGAVRGMTRRTVLRAGAGAAAGSLLPWSSLSGGLDTVLAATAAPIRKPNSLPDPSRPAGEPTAALPFDHLIVAMMENHSFDNYLGMLPRRGQRKADGFRFDRHGRPSNRQPLRGGYVVPLHATSNCQPVDVSQAWNATHIQIDHGRMDGFARSDVGGPIAGAHIPGVSSGANMGSTQGGDEENPQDITLGEDFVSRVATAVLGSPAWIRTLLVWTYDEHGGYFDHVPPPRAIPPDSIKPKLGAHDIKGG